MLCSFIFLTTLSLSGSQGGCWTLSQLHMFLLYTLYLGRLATCKPIYAYPCVTIKLAETFFTCGVTPQRVHCIKEIKWGWISNTFSPLWKDWPKSLSILWLVYVTDIEWSVFYELKQLHFSVVIGKICAWMFTFLKCIFKIKLLGLFFFIGITHFGWAT